LAVKSSEYRQLNDTKRAKRLIFLVSESGTRGALREAPFPLETTMTDHTAYRFHRAGTGFARGADRLIDRVRAYLSTRRAADWGFFLAGVVIGGLLF
jgi:hypothetical protein